MARKMISAKVFQMFLLAAAIFGSFSALSVGKLYAAPKQESQAKAPQVVINVNKATAEELEKIRGIGPALAERIIKYRDEHGPFKKVEDLGNIHGIGEAKFEKIKDQVSI